MEGNDFRDFGKWSLNIDRDCLIEVLLIQIWLNGNTWFFKFRHNFVKLFDQEKVCENPTKLVHVSSEDLIFSQFFNNYSLKAKLILLNNPRDKVKGIIQQY